MYLSWDGKAGHFAAIKEKTHIPYSEMIFFDDEMSNTFTVLLCSNDCTLYLSNLSFPFVLDL